MNCIICQKPLSGKQKKFCSLRCKSKDSNQHGYHTQRYRYIKRKTELIKQFRSQCSRCGYEKNLSALHFHHRDPIAKTMKLTTRELGTRSMVAIKAELKKCDLLCANCHAEVHNPDLDL